MTTPAINGRVYTMASVELKLDGQIYTGFKAINYKQSNKRKKVKASAPMPVGKTRGTYEAEVDIELLVEHANLLRAALAAINPSYSLVDFDIDVIFDEGSGARHVKCVQCSLDEEEVGVTGEDETTEKIVLCCMWLEKDGLRMLSAADGGT